jgi:ribosomal protein L37E
MKKIAKLLLVLVISLSLSATSVSAMAADYTMDEDWFPAETRVCEHLPLALDVLWQRVDVDGNIDAKWECIDKSHPILVNIIEISTQIGSNVLDFWDPCNRPGCKGTIQTTITTTTPVITGTRVCPHHSVCLQVQWSFHIITTQRCNLCGFGSQNSTPSSRWECT